ncbi:O-sialoglycoprotein endopeptidase related protein [Thermoplasma acidophilum]|uniref:Probable bifunctional tRNA threonylcarbamoyladenosine biosynthesis protein n=1 Tax=Thermoplasma acidophilum (strain ATCC 25905 / DSM 1728 / JCM 9062 / NBRC 15155 / AMRC-C165) TaxID=273075 RepID=KAE1B_THEAC|nr:bifunctional N(6)-L-threonylcarbamoyladenine synthase/serine/threonine protein kinase [Thermoplasma acidophilum]Q9HLA5.1 RecName: Full=Probable bifunctional tRNA threonylcarbamoyladenosine biosynthesis protein; Includes: RecName: Full=tRNA N6-adenosine threonylcarbamoyltransferase; AltName: Full=N6-L-threonylcarbamoyladenine synthase; Short=t(6)A synthase; AltName: Full=t(6)A37 threonylcarbamoyladenosine biosynthesis protein Kae1; AltName: Full=tRNA threonylcarbamoyladenosine biosynthesis prote
MIVLGLEGTAHTISCGIIDESRILAMESSMYRPKTGGIRPLDAAVHHSEVIDTVISRALEKAKISIHDIDLIGFSMGPGLAPSLRVTATAARTISVLTGKPIIGVNHPLGHIEIGRRVTGAIDPVMLYVSGGNTQVIAHVNGRYRVLGETLDIGIGNMIDKFAREAGIPFPGGPEIEKLAMKGTKLLDLPYSVKGMDTAFSGILTAALQYLKTGQAIEDISYSIQETAFAMLVEVLERALYVSGKDEILMAGGVALNRRLRDMVTNMAREAGIRSYLTDREYCMDNGIMIAQAALLMYKSGVRMSVEETAVNPRFRIDEVDAPWITDASRKDYGKAGAESRIEEVSFHGRPAIRKVRISKSYRNSDLDKKIRYERMRNEFTILRKLKEAGVNSPVVYDFDPFSMSITMQKIPGRMMSAELNEGRTDFLNELGIMIAKMHRAGIAHGDLTVNNIIVNDSVFIIDPSMGKVNAEIEDMAVDIYALEDSIKGLGLDSGSVIGQMLKSYRNNFNLADDVLETVSAIRRRHRYV